jgi:hypothetical protein
VKIVLHNIFNEEIYLLFLDDCNTPMDSLFVNASYFLLFNSLLQWGSCNNYVINFRIEALSLLPVTKLFPITRK